jgi:hypothetical protein
MNGKGILRGCYAKFVEDADHRKREVGGVIALLALSPGFVAHARDKAHIGYLQLQ